MDTSDPSQIEREEVRIHQAYERRACSLGSKRDGYFDKANLAIIQERDRVLLECFRKLGLTDLSSVRLLEIGCGDGFWLRQFIHWGGEPENVAGIDLLAERIGRARQSLPMQVHLQCGSATSLSFPSESFDLVLQSTVFSSILDASVRTRVAGEMLRMLKPGGLIIWYDLRVGNPVNPDVRPIKKGEIARLFTGCAVRLRRITVAPPLARAIALGVPLLYQPISSLKLFCSHYLGIIEKPLSRTAGPHGRRLDCLGR